MCIIGDIASLDPDEMRCVVMMSKLSSGDSGHSDEYCELDILKSFLDETLRLVTGNLQVCRLDCTSLGSMDLERSQFFTSLFKIVPEILEQPPKCLLIGVHRLLLACKFLYLHTF